MELLAWPLVMPCGQPGAPTATLNHYVQIYAEKRIVEAREALFAEVETGRLDISGIAAVNRLVASSSFARGANNIRGLAENQLGPFAFRYQLGTSAPLFVPR